MTWERKLELVAMAWGRMCDNTSDAGKWSIKHWRERERVLLTCVPGKALLILQRMFWRDQNTPWRTVFREAGQYQLKGSISQWCPLTSFVPLCVHQWVIMWCDGVVVTVMVLITRCDGWFWKTSGLACQIRSVSFLPRVLSTVISSHLCPFHSKILGERMWVFSGSLEPITFPCMGIAGACMFSNGCCF